MVLATNKDTESSGNSNQSKCNTPMIKRKYNGPKKKIGGVQHWWCPHHKWEGEFDGLYMPCNPGKGHEEWQKAKDARKLKYKQQKNSNSPFCPTASKTPKKLQCSSEMRAALCTTFQIEPDDFDEKIAESQDFQ